jgi:hypothetical protein
MKGGETMKLVRVGNDFNMVADETAENSDTYSVRNVTNMVAMRLAEDVTEYRKGNKELDRQIELETNALNALAKVTEVLN